MATKVNIDRRLLERARRLGGHRTNSQAVNAALAEYLRHRQAQGLIELFGTIDYDPTYNYKAQRRRR
jgi:hypothetical protein